LQGRGRIDSCCIQSIQSFYWRGQGSRVSGGLEGLASDVGPAAGSCPTPSPPPRAEVVAVHQDSHGGKKWSRQISRHPPGVGFSSVYPSSTATRAKTMWLEKCSWQPLTPFLRTPFLRTLSGHRKSRRRSPCGWLAMSRARQRGLSRSSVDPTQEHRASESESEGVVTRHRRGQHVRPCPLSMRVPASSQHTQAKRSPCGGGVRRRARIPSASKL